MRFLGRQRLGRVGSARGRVARYLSLLCLVGSVFVLGGCAASRTAGPRTPTPTNDPLPGAGRALPSEENQVPVTAPPAFPNYPADLSSSGGASAGARGSESAVPSESGPAGIPKSSGTPGASSAGTIGTVTAGTAPVRPSEPVPPVPAQAPAVPPSAAFYTVQLQVASTAERAKEWEERAATIFRVPVRVDVESGLYKVRVGTFTTSDAAEEMRRDAVGAGYVDALVVSVAGAAAAGGGGGPR